MVLAFPVVAPDVKLREVGLAASVKLGAVSVTVIAVEFETVARIPPVLVPVPFTAIEATPEVPGVELTVMVVVPVPLEVSVTVDGENVQVGAGDTFPVTVQEGVTTPAKPLDEVKVITSAVLVPDINVPETGNALDAAEAVMVGPVMVTATCVLAVAAIVPPVGMPEPETVAVSTPLGRPVVEMVSAVVVVPPDVRVTEVGLVEQLVAAVVPIVGMNAPWQESVTVPAKPFCDVSVIMLGTLVPEATAAVVGFADIAKPEGVSVTTILLLVTTVVPLVPVTVTFSVPAVPAVVVIVSTSVLEEPEVRASVPEASEQVPAAVPVAFATEQVMVTVPAKLSTEAMVMLSVLPVVAPE